MRRSSRQQNLISFTLIGLAGINFANNSYTETHKNDDTYRIYLPSSIITGSPEFQIFLQEIDYKEEKSTRQNNYFSTLISLKT